MKLRGCPFCGHSAGKYIPVSERWECGFCEARGPRVKPHARRENISDDVMEAIAVQVWNVRAKDPLPKNAKWS